MVEYEEIGDSQSDGEISTAILWTEVTKARDVLTRKEKQLNKLHRDLQPLTNEFKNAPLSKTRNSSFQKNNQFTVVAAEFLNLSSKSELNRLYEAGFSKDDIETMLEYKYQEKKKFFTEAGVKNHKFKRKSFEAWRSMSNSNSTSVNTFMSEEELFNQMDKSLQLRLKRINNKPLDHFRKSTRKQLTDTKKSFPTNDSIPRENGLIGIQSDNNSSLMIISNNNSILNNDSARKTGFVSGTVSSEIYNGMPSSPQRMPAENNESLSILSDQVNRNPSTYKQFTSSITSDAKPFEEEEGEKEKEEKAGSFNLIEEIIHANVSDSSAHTVGGSFNEYSNIKKSPPKSNVNINDQNAILLESSPLKKMEPNDIPNPLLIPSRRSFRQRTIINRNPYLVDRAQFYGLATTDELLHMEENGYTESKILEYLNKQYQKSHKNKSSGYKTFYDIINDQYQDKTGGNDPDTQTFEPQASDAESDYSIDDDDGEDFGEEEDSIPIDSTDGNDNKSVELRSYKVYNISDIGIALNASKKMSKKDEIENGTLKKKKQNVLSSKLPKKNPVLNVNHENDIQITKRKEENSLQNVESSNKIENPYTLEFLTLSDEEMEAQKTNRNTHNNYVASDEYTEQIAKTLGPLNKDRNEIVNPAEKRKVRSILTKAGLTMRQQNLDTVMKYNKRKRESLSFNTESNKKKVSRHNVDTAIGFYVPLEDNNYMFSRKPLLETLHLEGQNKILSKRTDYTTVVPFDVNNAKRIVQDITDKRVTTEDTNEYRDALEKNNIILNWDKIKCLKSVEEKRASFISRLKPDDYLKFEFTDKLISSPLILRTLDDTDYFYRKKTINLNFMGSKITFEVPLKSNTLSKITAFLNLLLGSIVDNKLNKAQLKELRKALIHIIMVISNVKKDCFEILEKIGLELNHSLNILKKQKIDEIVFCNISVFFLVFMVMIQKYLPPISEYYSSFQHSQRWLEKKYLQNFLKIPFESIFVTKKPIVLSTLSLFLKCTKNMNVLQLNKINFHHLDIYNYINFFYYCNCGKVPGKDWNFISKLLSLYEDSGSTDKKDHVQIKGLFIAIHKLCVDFRWEIEDQLLIKMFRVLAENKFENIGSLAVSKATIYPNAVASVGLTEEDGCINIYFKLLDIFSRQYMSENTKVIIERLIPVRSTFGYTDIQLQNRAKVLLMMSHIFDQDLMSGIESILRDMIRSGTSYAIRASLALLKNLVQQTSRKPYNLIRKYTPLLIHKINSSAKDDSIRNIFKDLILSVNELLNGQDISYLNRILDFFSIMLKLKDYGNDSILNTTFNKSFNVIKQQFEFINEFELTEKDKQRLGSRLQEIVKQSKARLTDYNEITESKFSYLNFWVFSSSKLKQPVAQLVYSEWYYFSDITFRARCELKFYEYLINWFDPTPVAEDVLVLVFRNLAIGHSDISAIMNGLVKYNILYLEKMHNVRITKDFIFENRYSITRACVSSLLKLQDEKMIFFVMKEFICTLKSEYENFHSRDYVKEICVYIYNISPTNKKFDIPEWEYLVEQLKLENVMHSIARKLQFISSGDDVVIILEKSYISSLLNYDRNKFDDQFLKFINLSHAYNGNLISLCTITMYHVNEILRLNEKHWIHLDHWMKYLTTYCRRQSAKLDISHILNLLLLLPKLKTLYAANYDYRYHFYSIIQNLYELLDWITLMFVGFDEFLVWKEKLWHFAELDISVSAGSHNVNYSANNELERKLHHLFTSLLTNDQTCAISDEKQIYDLETKLPLIKNAFISKWGLETV